MKQVEGKHQNLKETCHAIESDLSNAVEKKVALISRLSSLNHQLESVTLHQKQLQGKLESSIHSVQEEIQQNNTAISSLKVELASLKAAKKQQWESRVELW